ITFNGGASSYTLGGTNSLSLSAAITDNATNAQIITLPIGLSGTQSIVVAGGGNLALNGIVSDATAGSGINFSGTGILSMGANHTYTGNTSIDGGTLRYTADNTGVKTIFFGAATLSTNVSTLD